MRLPQRVLICVVYTLLRDAPRAPGFNTREDELLRLDSYSEVISELIGNHGGILVKPIYSCNKIHALERSILNITLTPFAHISFFYTVYNLQHSETMQKPYFFYETEIALK